MALTNGSGNFILKPISLKPATTNGLHLTLKTHLMSLHCRNVVTSVIEDELTLDRARTLSPACFVGGFQVESDDKRQPGGVFSLVWRSDDDTSINFNVVHTCTRFSTCDACSRDYIMLMYNGGSSCEHRARLLSRAAYALEVHACFRMGNALNAFHLDA